MMTAKFKILFIALLCVGSTVKSATVNKTIYINKGIFTTIIETTFPAYALNDSANFVAQNTNVTITTKDVLILKVINNDTVTHGFDIKHYPNANRTINAKDSVIYTLQFNTEGVFIYYDSYLSPKYSYMGAAGMIAVFNSTKDKKFYWNLKDYESSYNELLADNKNVEWNKYTPNYFTINGYSYPNIQLDSTAFVEAMVGDTVHIFIANTGQAPHSLHIHGFHGKIISSTVANQIGWEKDTFPIKSMESLIIQLVPDKTGYYYVHDHNLLSGTAAGQFMRGMLTSMHFY